MNHSRVWGSLSLLGGVTAVLLLIAFFITGWGAPGTAAYQTYELLNRLMAVTLLFMAAGWVGAWQVVNGYGRWAAILALIGVFIKAIGTGAEFWLYTDLPYAGESMRQVAFTAVSIGGLLLDMGAMMVGVVVWRSHLWPRWSAFVLLMAFPIDLAAFFLLNAIFMAATILTLVVSYALLFKSNLPDDVGTAVP